MLGSLWGMKIGTLFGVLKVLRWQVLGMNIVRISRTAPLTYAHVYRVLDLMIASGLVARVAAPDKRQKFFVITEAGKAVFDMLELIEGGAAGGGVVRDGVVNGGVAGGDGKEGGEAVVHEDV